MKTIIASASGGLLFAVLGAMAALANPYDGNPLDWFPNEEGVQIMLRQSLIGSKDVDGDLIQVCSPQFPSSTMFALYTWTVQLHSAHPYYPADPDFYAFEWNVDPYGNPTCDYADVKVGTEYFDQCPVDQYGNGPHACTYVRSWNLEQHSLGMTFVALNPSGHWDWNEQRYIPWSDGDQHTNRDIAHELGHSFGAGEYHGCPDDWTVMDTDENPACWVDYATLWDAYNYYRLYHPPEVQDARCEPKCYSTSTTVHLKWSPIVQDVDGWDRDMPNEKAFVICRDMAGTTEGDGCFWWVEKDSGTKTLYDEPTGVKTYAICSISDKADNSSPNNIECAMVSDDPVPTHTPKPTYTPTKTPTNTPTITPTPTRTPTPTATPNIDTDGDGFLDHLDNCPDDYNDDQLNADGDSFGDVCDVCPNDGNNDVDNDGICGDQDNCANDYNPDQLNTDRLRPNGSQIPGEFASNPTSDLLGDACDDDDDADAVLDSIELSPGCGNPVAPTNPLKADTDDDRVIDGGECRLASNPNNPNSKPTCSFGIIPDKDKDCLPAPLEWLIGSSDNNRDSDGDGIDDGIEVKGYATSPTKSDSDGDGCPDWLEIMDLNGDRSVDASDVSLLNERVAGTIPADDPVSESVFDVNKDGYIDVGDEELLANNTCDSKGYDCPCSPEYESSAPVTPVAPAVGGVAELPEGELPSASTAGGPSAANTVALAGIAAGVVVLAEGGWYARRRRVRRET